MDLGVVLGTDDSALYEIKVLEMQAAEQPES